MTNNFAIYNHPIFPFLANVEMAKKKKKNGLGLFFMFSKWNKIFKKFLTDSLKFYLR